MMKKIPILVFLLFFIFIQSVFSQNIDEPSSGLMAGVNLGLFSSGGNTYGYDLVTGGFQLGFYGYLFKTNFNLCLDSNIGLTVAGDIDRFITGTLGGLIEIQKGKFLIGFGAGVSHEFFGLFPLWFFLHLLFDSDDSSNSDDGSEGKDNGIGRKNPIIPYLKFTFSFGEGGTDGFVGVTAFFEYYINYGFRTGVYATLRIYDLF